MSSLLPSLLVSRDTDPGSNFLCGELQADVRCTCSVPLPVNEECATRNGATIVFEVVLDESQPMYGEGRCGTPVHRTEFRPVRRNRERRDDVPLHEFAEEGPFDDVPIAFEPGADALWASGRLQAVDIARIGLKQGRVVLNAGRNENPAQAVFPGDVVGAEIDKPRFDLVVRRASRIAGKFCLRPDALRRAWVARSRRTGSSVVSCVSSSK